MTVRLRWRVPVIVFLAALLGGLFVWAGTVGPAPADNNYPGNSDIEDNPNKHIGDRVSVGGTVVETEPLTIEDEEVMFVIENAERDVAAGDLLRVYGTLQAGNRVDAIETSHREPWEIQYMYLVSFLAGLWVLGRVLNRWTVDTTNWAVVPRPVPLVTLRS